MKKHENKEGGEAKKDSILKRLRERKEQKEIEEFKKILSDKEKFDSIFMIGTANTSP